MAPKNSQKAKPEELAADAGVDIQPAAGKDKRKVPGGKAGGAASGWQPFAVTARQPQTSYTE